MSPLLWCGPGLNRRHKDFQSFALPTELPHHHPFNWTIPFRGSKNRSFDLKTHKQINQFNLTRLLFCSITLMKQYLLQNGNAHRLLAYARNSHLLYQYQLLLHRLQYCVPHKNQAFLAFPQCRQSLSQ